MIDRHSRGRRVSLAALGFALILAAPWAKAAAPPEDKLAENARVTIRHDFKPGRLLRYRLQLSGQTAWTPPLRLADVGQMATDFTFTLHTKTLRPGGACTFDLLGERLRSAGQTPAGRIDVAAVRNRAVLGLSGRDSIGVSSDKSPLDHPMTITLGPRGRFHFGTGLLPLAIYMIPHVDHRFWNLLTLAPQQPVSAGDAWEVDFALPVPGAKGTPLQLEGKWSVLERETHGRRSLLPIELTANLDLENSNVLLKNGEEIHVSKGSYRAAGRVLWDVEAGLLSSATAGQTILITADAPIHRALQSRAQCTLELLGVEEPR